MVFTFSDVIEAFIKGETEMIAGTIKNPGNLKIKGNQLIHYSTPIAERYKNKYIVNITRYSIQTGRVQKRLKEVIPANKIIEVKRVEQDYKGSLTDFLL